MIRINSIKCWLSYKNHEKCTKTPGTGMDQAHKKQQSVVVVFKVFRNCDNKWHRVLACDTLIESHFQEIPGA